MPALDLDLFCAESYFWIQIVKSWTASLRVRFEAGVREIEVELTYGYVLGYRWQLQHLAVSALISEVVTCLQGEDR